jgi:methionine-rich copper-binding protein CopC
VRLRNKNSIARVFTILVTTAIATGTAQQSWSHAFPVRSEPRVGWTIPSAPSKVTIWFDGELETAFSVIMVYNSAKQQVDKGNSRVIGSDGSVLEVDLPVLASGSYRVYWKALSKDTHVTEGDFSFSIEKK